MFSKLLNNNPISMKESSTVEEVRKKMRKVQRCIRQNKIQEAWSNLDTIDASMIEQCGESEKQLISEARQILLHIMVRELKEK
jgi:hypothetical protein